MKFSSEEIFIRLFFTILGLILIYLGFLAIKTGGWFAFGGFWIRSEENSVFVGIFFILLGLSSVCFSVWPKRFRWFGLDGKFYKCVKCGRLLNWKVVKKLTCPDCEGDLDELNGFYNRHPEQKER